jgi:hypothetical protein
MTRLRSDFIAHLQLRGFSDHTIRNYIESVAMYARHFKKSPLELKHEHVKEYLLFLRNVKKLAVRTINLHMYSIRSFYNHFLPGLNLMGDIRRMKVPESHPEILSRQEVFSLIDSAPNLKIKAVVAVLYSSGIRLSECADLKMSCIERDRKVIPFAVMRTLFRAKVLDYFKQGLSNGTVTLSGNLAVYEDKSRLDALLGKLYKVKWVIFVKQPFAGPKRVIEYLGNYTHRVAIAESRLVNHGGEVVSFSYKDYADDGRKKIMTLNAVEFIRRFLLHVLPSGFMRIRHYGFLSNSSRRQGLLRCEKIFASMRREREKNQQKEKQPWYLRIKERTGIHPLLCKICGKAVMVLTSLIDPVATGGLPRFAGP